MFETHLTYSNVHLYPIQTLTLLLELTALRIEPSLKVTSYFALYNSAYQSMAV